jgi:hypothetical protein
MTREDLIAACKQKDPGFSYLRVPLDDGGVLFQARAAGLEHSKRLAKGEMAGADAAELELLEAALTHYDDRHETPVTHVEGKIVDTK